MKIVLIIYVVSLIILLTSYIVNFIRDKSSKFFDDSWYYYLIILVLAPIFAISFSYITIKDFIEKSKKKIVKRRHEKRLLGIEVQDTFLGIKFGNSLDHFKLLLKSDKVTDLNKIYLKTIPECDSYVVINSSNQITFQNTKWDFVIFDFYKNKFCSIRFINDNYYHLEEDIKFENHQYFSDIFDSFVEKYNLYQEKNYRRSYASGVFKNKRKIDIDYNDSSMCIQEDRGLVMYDTSSICLRFHDLSILGE